MNQVEYICKRFNRIANQYDTSARIPALAGENLIERLDYIKITPQYILDLGCGTGHYMPLLQKRYPNATIIGLDIAQKMLNIAQKKQRLFQKKPLILADMHQLPFQDGIFDLVFSNQVFFQTEKTNLLLREINRIMRPDGCLMLSTLGPDTGQEIEHAWKNIDTYMHRNTYLDMHDLGDMLVQEHFLDPVIDMEYLAIHYSNTEKMLQELKNQGSIVTHQNKQKGLTPKNHLHLFLKNFEQFKTPKGRFPLTYEIIYAQAFKGLKRRIAQGHEAYVSIDQIKNNSQHK